MEHYVVVDTVEVVQIEITGYGSPQLTVWVVVKHVTYEFLILHLRRSKP